MKRLTLLLLAHIAVLIASSSVINIDSGETLPDNASFDVTAPTRTQEYVDDGIVVTYMFENLWLDSIDFEMRNVFIPRFYGMSDLPFEEGLPDLPYKKDRHLLSLGCVPTVSLIEYEYSEYFFEIAPAAFPMLDCIDCLSSPRMPISLSAGFYPQEIVRIDRVNEAKGRLYIDVDITPIAYDHSTKTVRVPNKIKYKLSYNNTESKRFSIKSKTKAVSYAANNPRVDSVYYGTNEIPGNYLILSTSEFKDPIARFAYWKRALGFKVYTAYNDNWDTDAAVKDTIDSYYNKCDSNIQYILLVGDHSHVPSQISILPKYLRSIFAPADSLWFSDYIYGCISSNHVFDVESDAICGRIPVKTKNEAITVFDKIIAYELCENRYDANFFKKDMFVANFQDGSIVEESNGVEDRNFIYTSEHLIDAAIRNGVTPVRLYKYTGTETPQKYKNYKPLPAVLTDESFAWNTGATEIRNALQNGASYVFYRGHGSISCWGNPYYSSDHIGQENRYTYNVFNTIKESLQPVVFSVACQTGRFEKNNCFATASLVQQHGGSVCMIAATCNTASYHNDSFALGMADAFYEKSIYSNEIISRTLSERYDPVFRIGNIMNQGLRRMEEYKPGYASEDNMKAYHCFGDPSMMIRSCEPTSFSDVKISLDDDTKICTVTTGDEPAFISFFDTNNGNVNCVYGTSAQFQFSDIHYNVGGSYPSPLYGKENVAIYAPNKIPVIQFTWREKVKQDLIKLDQSVFKSSDLVVVLSDTYGENDMVFVQVSNALSGAVVCKYECANTTEPQYFDASNLPAGTYVVSLVVNGNVVDSVTTIK